RDDQLFERMKRAIAEQSKTSDANNSPSALGLWSEVGSVLPNADTIGLSLESIQFNSDGGRITGKVNAAAGDPLAHAAALENALNNASHLVARGEFENKGAEIVVRMRLDYQPHEKTGEGRKP